MAVIEVNELVKRYGRHRAVDGISFSVDEGEIFGILGPNGAGKTTTVECIEGLRRPDSGSVSVLGLDPQHDGRELKQLLGAQLQESRLPDKIRVDEALDLYGSFYRSQADPDQLIDLLRLGEKRKSHYAELSGGQRQRLSIALALIGNPRVAVLDELTTGLDPQARRDTWDLIERIRDTGVTIVLVTHFMDEAERLCDRLAVIDTGRVVAMDTPTGLAARVAPEQRVRFRPSAPIDDADLLALPEVTGVARRGAQLIVTGRGNLLHAVTALLAGRRIIAADLRVDQTSLDDAFVAITGKPFDN